MKLLFLNSYEIATWNMRYETYLNLFLTGDYYENIHADTKQ